MQTYQKYFNNSSEDLSFIVDKSVNLVVTSPPYPMIDMWDESFAAQGIAQNDYNLAFDKMHELLNSVWAECDRVLTDNGFICINIGDAVKNCNGVFKLFPNHSKIIEFFTSLNYCMLPTIIWNKPANSPNKFMGSGMLPAGAYVTLEHEYILIFRKGAKRDFKSEKAKKNRQESAYFWEERNIWFSNIWDIKGSSQKVSNIDRKRSGAYPFELPYRLINMYSVKGDVVLDPFLGTGTTLLASAVSQRNGIGVELSESFYQLAMKNLENSKCFLNSVVGERLQKHNDFISSLSQEKKDKCYKNDFLDVLVKTNQEKYLQLSAIDKIFKKNDEYILTYTKELDNYVKRMGVEQCCQQISIKF